MAQAWVGKPGSRLRREWTYSALVIAVGLTATCALFVSLRDADARLVESHFHSDAAELDAELQLGFSRATSGLRDLGSLLSIKPELTAEEFRHFAEPLLAEHSSVRAFSWNPVVLDADRSGWERTSAAMRALEQRINERAPNGKLVPAEHREDYVVVRYIEPLEQNRSAIGYDVASEPKRRAALERARDTGRVSATEPLVLVQASGRPDGVLAFQPVYEPADPDDTAEPGAVLRGYGVAVVLLGDIVELAVNRRSFQDVRIGLRAEDSDTAPIVDTHAADAESMPRGTPLVVSTVFSWANREWVLEFRPTPSYLTAHRSHTADIALVCGIVFTMLLAIPVHALANRASRLRAEVAIRQSAEQTLEKNEERLKLAVSVAAEGIWDWDLRTGQVYFSPAWKAALGYREDEVPSRIEFWESILHPDDRPAVEKALHRHLAGKTAHYECENRLLRADGTWRWNLDSGRVVERDSQGRPLRMVGIDRDISERKQSEEAQAKIDRQLQETQKLESLGVLAGSIAHDFGNILTGILGCATEARWHAKTQKIRVHLDGITDSARKAAELCRQLLVYAGRATVQPTSLDLGALIQDSLQLLTTSIAKRAELEVDIAEGLPPVIGDATQLRQILVNLILNAAESLEGKAGGKIRIATGIGHPTAEELARAEVAASLAGRACVYLEVEDNGCGMSDDVRAHLFEPFVTSKATGRGLGLATVLGIVRSHGGALFLETSRDEGSTFRLALPTFSLDQDETVPIASSVSTRVASDVVLVVDDEDTARQSAVAMLGQLGYRAESVATGAAALERLDNARSAIGCVLLDLVMPDMGGAETYRRLRSQHPTVPIVLASGRGAEEIASLLATLPTRQILRKPLDPAHLHAAIGEVISARTRRVQHSR